MIRLFNRWTWGRYVARRCPGCGCDPDHPCMFPLPDDQGEATCVPAGAFNFRRCSRCSSGMLLMPSDKPAALEAAAE